MVIHLVSGSPATKRTISQFAATHRSSIEIRRSDRVPLLVDRSDAMLAIDLTGEKWHRVAQPTVWDRVHTVVLVRPGQLLPLHWVHFVRRTEVVLLTVDVGRLDPYLDLLSFLESQISVPVSTDMTTAVVEANAALAGLESLVQAVFDSPWEVRKARDLAERARVQHHSLRALCEHAGFRRVEHLITAIRAGGLAYLVGAKGLGVRPARLVVGVADPSNFRRQSHRAGIASQRVV